MYSPREAQRDFLYTRVTLLFFVMLMLILSKIYRHKEEDRRY
ncbi:hypothetical protein [Pseudomonas mucidolens]